MTALRTDSGRGGELVLRLPKQVEADPRAASLLRGLQTHVARLWVGGSIEVPFARWTPALEGALSSARSAGYVSRGLERADERLAAEERGLRLADRERGVPRGERISRLLLLTDDGAERFYRQVESLLRRHRARVLALRLDVDAARLGEHLFGAGREARLAMLEHRDAVSAVLLAISEQWPE